MPSIDKDSNGTIDREELKKCLEELQLHLKEEEIEDLFKSCDIDGNEGIQFNEFIVLLCLIYLLTTPSSSSVNLSTNKLNIYSFTPFSLCSPPTDPALISVFDGLGIVSDVEDGLTSAQGHI